MPIPPSPSEARYGEPWQPIETAPKDGTKILAWVKYSDTPVIVTWYLTRWFPSTENMESEGCGYCGCTINLESGIEITHWTPLPSPPAP